MNMLFNHDLVNMIFSFGEFNHRKGYANPFNSEGSSVSSSSNTILKGSNDEPEKGLEGSVYRRRRRNS